MKNHKKLKIVLLVCLVLIAYVIIGTVIDAHTISAAVRDESIVYVPESMAKEIHHDFTAFLDDFECYIIEPNKKERELLLDDIKKGSWSRMNENHELVLHNICGSFGDGDVVVGEICNDNEKYICIYDSFNNKNVTDYSSSDIYSTVHWRIFVYDVDENLYYYFYVAY